MKYIAIIIFFVLIGTVQAQDHISSFTGYVGKPTEETDNLFKRFNDFMLENEGNIVFLDISIDADQQDALKEPTDDFYFFAVYDNYDERLTGIEYHFVKLKTSENYKFNTELNELTGYFKILEITGPQNGLLVVKVVPVIEVTR